MEENLQTQAGPVTQAQRDYAYAEYSNRHAAAVFLILYALVGMDIMAIEDERQRERMTAAWVAWGTVFILLGFFLIAPEQDAIYRRLGRLTARRG
ncbi:hypothetical protein [Alicyclobacillus sp.]|uniref:hypothetical protein n=1 Tax=Alicyclobacillus sp. TaxID=61169 RepID=UPI0025BBE00A|nr:hypothetical protein [Alicyclobacillus sp.]MCL6517730.1 hypothetical protein [Alicyclobacillus sp.]